MLGKKVVVTGVFLILIFVLAIMFGPVPQASSANTQHTFGTIEKVFEAGSHGIVFRLKGDDRLFYIDMIENRGTDLNLLQADLQGQRAEIYFVKHWVPIGPMSKRKQIAKVAVNKTTLYSAFK